MRWDGETEGWFFSEIVRGTGCAVYKVAHTFPVPILNPLIVYAMCITAFTERITAGSTREIAR